MFNLLENRWSRYFFSFVYFGPLFNFLNYDFNQILRKSFFSSELRRLKSNKRTRIASSISSAVSLYKVLQGGQKDGGIPDSTSFQFSKYVAGGSYPEVNGYIIPTLIDYSKLFNDKSVIRNIDKLKNFILSQQNEDGSFPGGAVGRFSGPSVFNSGQILHGLVLHYKHFKDDSIMSNIEAVADWICTSQNKDGSWSKYNYKNLKRTYDSKVSQPLLEAYEILNKEEYLSSALKNLDFVISNQLDNGWFQNCDNSEGKNNEPLLHCIGYTTQGLIESFKITKDKKYLKSAIKCLNRLLKIFEERGTLLPGRFNYKWHPTVKTSCVTGCAQISICWIEIYNILGIKRYRDAAFSMNQMLREIQINSGNSKINGFLPASFPFWGDYLPFKMNTWGVKYALDAWMLEYKLLSKND